MPLLNDEQLHAIREIVRDYHASFVANYIGPEAVSPQILERLKTKGLVSTERSAIEESYLYGHVLAAVEDPRVPKMNLEQFREYMRKNPVPLSDAERSAIDFAKHRAAQYVVGLGNKVDTDTGQLLIEADEQLRSQRKEEIRTAVQEGIRERQAIKKIVSNLKWKTRDWSRDWDRIAVTEKHNAMQRGVADTYARKYGNDVLVAKRPTPDACEHCKRLHLGPDGHPRIFKLRDLERNGTNVGRKARQWLPTVGPVHPNCQCQLIRIPEGWGFTEEGELAPGGKFGIRYKSAEDLERSLQGEIDLLKAFKLQGHTEFQGLSIAIENRAGTYRTWKAEDGTTGRTRMEYAYGYIKKTTGDDAEEIDCYLGPDPRARTAFVLHQLNPSLGIGDEDKVFLGFTSAEDAKRAFLAHRNDGARAYGGVTPMPMEQFKLWIEASPEPVSPPKGPTLVLTKGITSPGGLQISGNLATEIGAQTSPADFRSPGHGTMANWYANIPEDVRRAPETYEDGLGTSPNEKDPKDVEADRKAGKTVVEDLPVGAGDLYTSYYQLDEADKYWVGDKEKIRKGGNKLQVNQGLVGPVMSMPEIQDWHPDEDPGINERGRSYADGEDYEHALTPVKDPPVTPVPEGFSPFTDEGHRQTEKRYRERLILNEEKGRMRPRNHVHVEDANEA